MNTQPRSNLTTLCYIEQDGKYLMLHRVKKEKDINKDKWIGVGGHFEPGESPEECMLREVWEETGYTLTSYRFRGLITFLYQGACEYMCLYTADGFTGETIECNEGTLEWVDIEKVWKLNLWEGDKIFFRLLDENRPFFSLKLAYDNDGILLEAVLDGVPLELFDVLDEQGQPTGIVTERGVSHREGSAHRTAHIWIVRGNRKSGYDVLLQKRSACKDSHPGCYDISSAGHVSAGDDCLSSAIREMGEELGIHATEKELEYVGEVHSNRNSVFYGKPFRDNEFSGVYVYRVEVDETKLKLQESEVEAVRFMDYEECLSRLKDSSFPNCIHEEEFRMLGEYLYQK